jgi:hypothetical protein
VQLKQCLTNGRLQESAGSINEGHPIYGPNKPKSDCLKKVGENPDTEKPWRIDDLLTRWTQISSHQFHRRAYQLAAGDAF